ncbi:MAG TPA: hypothetical protein VGF57_07080 [Roseiarcus sp.]|jgi:hypothetical protein
MEPLQNRTELERLLADVWDYEDQVRSSSRLPKWLFALTLTGALICTFSPSDIVAPVVTALAPASDRLWVDKVSSDNVAEDLDYRIAQHAESVAGWRAFLDAHADGPHAQAAQAEFDRLTTTPAPPQVEAAEQFPPSPAPPAPPSIMVEEEPSAPPQPVAVAEQSTPSPAATQTPVDAEPPVMVEKEPPPSQRVEVAEDSLPSLLATQTPVNGAPPEVMVETEPASPPQPVAAAASAPLPPARPRDIAVATSVEPAHHSRLRAEHRQTSQPNVFAVLVAQLFQRHRQHLDVMNRGVALR